MHAIGHTLTLAEVTTRDLYRYSRAFRVGGLTFVRVGRFQLSFCVCRAR